MSRVWGLALIFLGIAAVPAIADDGYSITAHILASGNSAQAASPCFRMNAVVGEPVAGYSSSTDYTLNAGFFAVAAPGSDGIFSSGFEDCTP
jgi:hypothetical protein